MLDLSDLPTVNATLNSVSLLLLVTGYAMIKRQRRSAHKWCMVAALVVSMLFLVSYLTYRFLGSEKRFGGQGWIRPVYFFILITHVALAATVPILALRTLYFALCGRFDRHRRLARLTLPIWLYVSVTGVLVYFLLFVLYGPAA